MGEDAYDEEFKDGRQLAVLAVYNAVTAQGVDQLRLIVGKDGWEKIGRDLRGIAVAFFFMTHHGRLFLADEYVWRQERFCDGYVDGGLAVIRELLGPAASA